MQDFISKEIPINDGKFCFEQVCFRIGKNKTVMRKIQHKINGGIDIGHWQNSVVPNKQYLNTFENITRYNLGEFKKLRQEKYQKSGVCLRLKSYFNMRLKHISDITLNRELLELREMC